MRIGDFDVKDCICVPGLSKNLLSVPQLMKKGYKIVFFGVKCIIYNSKGETVLSGTLQDSNLITVDSFLHPTDRDFSFLSDAKVQDLADLAHRRFCHVHSACLRNMATSNVVKGMQKHGKCEINDTHFCESCVHGKMRRLPKPSSSEVRATKPGERIFIDSKTLPVHTNQGYRHLHVIVDDKTRMKWGYATKDRSSFPLVFRAFQQDLSKQFPGAKIGRVIQILRTDGAGEETSNEFEEILNIEGIAHEVRAADAPEQMGVAERAIQTVVNIFRTMLISSQLDKKLRELG